MHALAFLALNLQVPYCDIVSVSKSSNKLLFEDLKAYLTIEVVFLQTN